MKNIRKKMASVFGMLTVLSLLLTCNTVSAAGGFPLLKTSFLSATSTISVLGNESRNEVYSIPNTTSNSLWFSSDSTRTIVRTHNDSSYLHIAGGKVEIYVRQEGQGGLYTRIDGVQSNAVTVETVESVTTKYVQYTIRKYTIDYNKLTNKDAPYTIFTAGIIDLTHPGTSTPYSRYETNVYIYWDRNE